MENVIFWLIVIGTGIWTIQWIGNAGKGLGYKTMIIPIILLWVMVIYFYMKPELSRYHLLWCSPLIIVSEMIVSTIVVSIVKRIRK
jgi:hypothetical protein